MGRSCGLLTGCGHPRHPMVARPSPGHGHRRHPALSRSRTLLTAIRVTGSTSHAPPPPSSRRWPRSSVPRGTARRGVRRERKPAVAITEYLKEYGHGRRHDAGAAGKRRPLRSPDPSLEPEDEALHLHRAQRHLHHRPAPVAVVHRPRLRVRQETVAHGGSIMFVGTKKQAQEAIAEQATRVGMPYVNQRWLGGMLTNFSTVYKRLQRLKELELIDFEDVAASGLTKKELLVLSREKAKLRRPSVVSARCRRCRAPSDRRHQEASTSPSVRRASSTSRSSRSSTPTATPTRSTTRFRATTTRSAPSPCSPA